MKTPLACFALVVASFTSPAARDSAPAPQEQVTPKTASAPVAGPPFYAIAPLPLPPGATWGGATVLNDLGQVAGVARNGESAPLYVVLWEQPTAPPRVLGRLPGYKFIEPRAINNAGQIVGVTSGDNGVRRRAFIIENGVLRDMGTPLGEVTEAFDINNRGEAVVTSARMESVKGSSGDLRRVQQTHVFLWTHESGLQEQHGPFKAAYGAAFVSDLKINDAGQIVGNGNGVKFGGPPVVEEPRESGDSIIYRKAFLWRGGATADPLRLPKGWSRTALAINNQGEVLMTGATQGDLPPRAANFTRPQSHLFIWKNGAAIDLGAASGYPFVSSSDINDAGEIPLTVIEGQDRERRYEPVLYRNGTLYRLNDCLPKNSGWRLTEARQINNRGQIVGTGTYKGEKRAFLLTPKS